MTKSRNDGRQLTVLSIPCTRTAGVNLALKKSTYAANSLTWKDVNLDASYAVDGVIGSNWRKMFHSGWRVKLPYLMVDFGVRANLSHIVLHSRGNACSDCLSNITVRLGDSGPPPINSTSLSDTVLTTLQGPGSRNGTNYVNVPQVSVSGRWLSLQMDNTGGRPTCHWGWALEDIYLFV